MKKYRIAVYRSVSNSGKERWSGYTRYYNVNWTGYIGIFEVVASSHREAKKKAIVLAKADYRGNEGGYIIA